MDEVQRFQVILRRTLYTNNICTITNLWSVSWTTILECTVASISFAVYISTFSYQHFHSFKPPSWWCDDQRSPTRLSKTDVTNLKLIDIDCLNSFVIHHQESHTLNCVWEDSQQFLRDHCWLPSELGNVHSKVTERRPVDQSYKYAKRSNSDSYFIFLLNDIGIPGNKSLNLTEITFIHQLKNIVGHFCHFQKI